MTSYTKETTLLEAVENSILSAARYDPGNAVPPVAILWTDADGQWLPLAKQMSSRKQELFLLGEYNPEEKTGPAIWLRCIIDQELPEAQFSEGLIPIIYMPKVSRQLLRAAEDCPDELKPLVELQYRGNVWTQRNGKDWTVEAFLVSEDGLGLDVAKDKATKSAMLRALDLLAVTPISRLQGKRLEAEDFDKLMISDTPRDILMWLDDPDNVRKVWSKERWVAFRSRCRSEYEFDPDEDGELVAAEKLGRRSTEPWKTLWGRFAEAPGLYNHIPQYLRRAKPTDTLIFDKEPWPDENESAENSLREALKSLKDASPAVARQAIEKLEQEHGARQNWVWAKLGMSPLVQALEHLHILAKKTSLSLGGSSKDEMSKRYRENGFLIDDAVLKALGTVSTSEDSKAVHSAIRSIYLPWLEDTARHFQELIATDPLPEASKMKALAIDEGECLLFVDGLRFDVSQRLKAMAEERNLVGAGNWRWAGLPTVTATGKPLVSPIAHALTGDSPGDDFAPIMEESKQPLTTDRFRRLLLEEGYQVFDSSELGDPHEDRARGWTELGEFDKLGHSLQSKMATRVNEQLELVLERIQELVKAGWKRVRVVTDHGWLLVPGGLPAISLPKYLTETRWSRCAVIRPDAHADVPTSTWSWNAHQQFAFAPGVYCFINGNEYAHGGLSLQECIVPELAFYRNPEAVPVSLTIEELQWIGMRCRVKTDSTGVEFLADLRTKPNDPASSISTPKTTDSSGRVSLLVADDSLEGTMASIVFMDSEGRVIAKQATTVGGD